MDEDKMKALKAQIEASIPEEKNDAEKYIAMAAAAPDEYAPILHDIAKEEMTHRAHLMSILHDIEHKMHHADTSAKAM